MVAERGAAAADETRYVGARPVHHAIEQTLILPGLPEGLQLRMGGAEEPDAGRGRRAGDAGELRDLDAGDVVAVPAVGDGDALGIVGRRIGFEGEAAEGRLPRRRTGDRGEVRRRRRPVDAARIGICRIGLDLLGDLEAEARGFAEAAVAGDAVADQAMGFLKGDGRPLGARPEIAVGDADIETLSDEEVLPGLDFRPLAAFAERLHGRYPWPNSGS